MSDRETFAFQAEINQLLSLIINAFYSNKEVFLRELISNASDALDKVRYAALTDNTIPAGDLEIKIIPDKEAKTLTIHDNGIGMSKEELVKNLGTIAHSGTRAFIESLQAGQQPDVSLIGQFGVGFYSAFLVADKVHVVSKSATSDQAYAWESNASGSFSIEPYLEDFSRGTKVILHMKDDQLEYLEEYKYQQVIKKHNGYCSFPIMCYVEREEMVKEEEPVKEDETTEEGKVEDAEENKDEEKEPKVIKKHVFEQFNKHQPIWLRKPEDVQPDEYKTFYKSLTSDWDDYMHHKHFSVDGSVQFKALLYVPKHAPYDMFIARPEDKKRDNIKLYVKKVLIMEETNDLLPEYLSFVKGVVDSDDLPLNVSREMLQQNSIMRVIKKNLVKKSIEIMTDLANGTSDEEKKNWRTFYEAFHKSIKLGIHEDQKNREKLVELLRFKTSKHNGEDDLSSLKEYVSRMKEGQKNIYFITGENLKAVKTSPFIKKLVKKGYEVLFLTEPIDEYMIQTLHEYDDKELVCCSKDGFEIETTEDDKKAFEELKKEWQPVCDKVKDLLAGKVIDVRITNHLDDTTPCVLTSDKYGWTANMERLMRAQALNSNQGMMMCKRILELNPDHDIVTGLKQNLVSDDKEKEGAATKIIELLHDTVLIDSGFSIEEPGKYAQKIYRLIKLGMSGESDDEPSAEDVVPVSDEAENKEVVDVSPLEELD